ncbi:MAG TPA: response regulator [Acidobacteriaceae bacterium]|nr:response regulator [Acidobacteriaceae bacterium]
MGRPVSNPARRKRKTRHVLVVEREEAICNLIRDVLGDIGLPVSCAANAAAARALLQRRRFALALVEMVLSDEDGEKLGAELAARGVAIVLMSGHPAGIERGEASSFTFLPKPFRSKELLRAVLDTIGA